MRLFFAIELGDALLELLDESTAPLRAEAPELAWVVRDNRHLTLKFLGDVDDAAVPKLTAAADRAAARHAPMEMTVRRGRRVPELSPGTRRMDRGRAGAAARVAASRSGAGV